MGTVDSVKQQKGGFKKVLGLGSLVVFGLAYLAPTAVFNYYGPIIYCIIKTDEVAKKFPQFCNDDFLIIAKGH